VGGLGKNLPQTYWEKSLLSQVGAVVMLLHVEISAGVYFRY